MEAETKKGMSLFTKVSIALNSLLFGITGILYLIDEKNYIGITLLVAGAMNIIYSLINITTKNLFFSILNFIFAVISLVVSIDYLLNEKTNWGILWMVITLYYLITGFILMMQARNKKATN